MAMSVKEFLESYDLYTKFRPATGVLWKGEWPQTVEAPCRNCAESRPHRIWASRVAGFSVEWGVYMIRGACERCGNDAAMFWVEVNQREGWMQKAGQLPAAPVAGAHAKASETEYRAAHVE